MTDDVRHITAGTAETMEASWCNSVSIPLFDQWQVAETTEANWCHLLTTTLFAQWQGPAHHSWDWWTNRCHSVSFTLFAQWQGPAHHCRDLWNSGGQSMPFGFFNSLRSVTKSYRTQQGLSVKTGQVKYAPIHHSVSIFAQEQDSTLQDTAGDVTAWQVNYSFSSQCLYFHTVTRFYSTGRSRNSCFYRSSKWLYLCTSRDKVLPTTPGIGQTGSGMWNDSLHSLLCLWPDLHVGTMFYTSQGGLIKRGGGCGMGVEVLWQLSVLCF